MISGLVHVPEPRGAEAVGRLADTLRAMVEGVAAGLIADAVVVSSRLEPGLRIVADAAGACLVSVGSSPTPWHAAAPLARREWVLCLDAGDIPQEGWVRTLDRFLHMDNPEIALGRLRRVEPFAWTTGLIDTLIGSRLPRAGDLVKRDRLLRNSSFRPRLKPRRLQARLSRG